jgi:hypothetical protein
MRITLCSTLLLATLFLTGDSAAAQGGTFRFLTQSMPDGSTNSQYAATLLTANAAGPVTYAVSAGTLPTGLALNATTGFISGRPTVVNTFNVTFSANDGTTTITFATTIKINASGGGGNAGVSFSTTSFPNGTVGTAYTATIAVANNKGPTIFAASDLPPGLSLNGLTGAISGTPSAAGTYYVTFTATDTGENNNKVIVVLPILILPVGSTFQFTNVILDNGQLGSEYSQPLTTSGAAGTVTFGASGLPAGLAVNTTTGEISGTPTVAGTFIVFASATDGTNTISLNRTIWIAPSATSNFFWVYDGLPAAVVNLSYDRQPPILLVTQNPGPGASVSYTAVGLPSGITYSSSSGQLAGTAIEVGVYPVTFTATNSANGEQISFLYDFIVTPPNGGDTNSLPINLWVKKQAIKKTGTAGKDSWQAQYIYNADRRTGKIFDPASQTFKATLGSTLSIEVPPAGFTGTEPKLSFKSAKGVLPAVAVKLDESSQTISLSSKGNTITDSLPSVVRNTVTIGNKGYKLDEFFDEKGTFTATSGYRKTAFVVAAAKITAKAAGKDGASFAMLLADPSFTYTSTTSPVRIRVFDGTTLLIDKTLTTLVSGTESTDSKTGVKVFKLKGGKDAEAINTLSKFSYDSKSGKLSLSLKNLTLTALTTAEAHLSVELTIDTKIYYTAVTVFAPKGGSYTTKK